MIFTRVNDRQAIRDISNLPVKSDSDSTFYTHARAPVTLFLAAFSAEKWNCATRAVSIILNERFLIYCDPIHLFVSNRFFVRTGNGVVDLEGVTRKGGTVRPKSRQGATHLCFHFCSPNIIVQNDRGALICQTRKAVKKEGADSLWNPLLAHVGAERKGKGWTRSRATEIEQYKENRTFFFIQVCKWFIIERFIIYLVVAW